MFLFLLCFLVFLRLTFFELEPFCRVEACGREVKIVNLESVSLGCVVSLDVKLCSTLSFFTQVCEWVSSDVLSGDGLVFRLGLVDQFPCVLHATLR